MVFTEKINLQSNINLYTMKLVNRFSLNQISKKVR